MIINDTAYFLKLMCVGKNGFKMNKIIENDYNSVEYKRSRVAYMAQCTFEYFVSLMVTDAFLAKLLTSLGISDSMVGIISSFVSMAFIIQLMSIFLVKTKISSKKLVMFFDTLSQLFFMFMYIIPFIPVSITAKKVLVVLSILLAYAGKYLIVSICYKWANSFVEPTKRASYSANKEIISLITGIIFTALTGYIIDSFENSGNLNNAFLFIALAMLIINICNFICLLLIKKESNKDLEANSKPLKDVIKNTLGNKNFKNVIILTVLWNVAKFFSVGFMGTFKTKDLLISVFSIQIINMVANVCRILVSKQFGRYSDRKSFAKGFELALYLAAIAFFANIFTTQKHWYFVVVYTVLYNVCLAGINQNDFNISYSYVKSEYITQAMAFKSSLGGICGFIASLVGSKLLVFVQNNNNQVFGITMYGQQLLSAISFVLVVITILFMHFVVAKQDVKIQ